MIIATSVWYYGFIVFKPSEFIAKSTLRQLLLTDFL